MDRADDVRPGHVEDLVAALVTLEVVEAGFGRLEHRPHGAVGDDDPLGQGAAEDIGAAAHRGKSTGTSEWSAGAWTSALGPAP